MLLVNRYSHLTLEERARISEGAHELAEHIADDWDLNFIDVADAHPGPQEIVRRHAQS